MQILTEESYRALRKLSVNKQQCILTWEIN